MSLTLACQRLTIHKAVAGAAASAPPITLLLSHALLARGASFLPLLKHLGRASATLGPAAASMDAWLIDARNHGASPHAESHTLDDMSWDLLHVLESERRHLAGKRVVLLGHSMGARTVMHLLLHHGAAMPVPVAGLVSLDAAPCKYAHTHDRVFDALRSVDLSAVKAAHEVDAQLAQSGLDPSTRQFVISNNLHSTPDGTWQWRCAVPTLADAHTGILDWGTPVMRQWLQPCLFIGGTQSSRLTAPGHAASVCVCMYLYMYVCMYVCVLAWMCVFIYACSTHVFSILYPASLSQIVTHFPNNVVQMLDGGHFVHNSHAPLVAQLICSFMNRL
jgi:pimeloyl-ACP methyl ester carboxylesterase